MIAREVGCCIMIRAYGLPGPQGSKRFLGKRGGRGIMVESSKKVAPWREAVKWAAIKAGQKITGPVSVVMVFTLPRPKSASKRKPMVPSTRPDLSKLIRSTEDALTGVLWRDDARIVCQLVRKVYAEDGRTGAQITVWTLPATVAEGGIEFRPDAAEALLRGGLFA